MQNQNQIAPSSAGLGRHEAARAANSVREGGRGESLEPGQGDRKGSPCLDTSVAERRFVLVNIETGELRNDDFLTSELACNFNDRLICQGSDWRWSPWGEQGSEAA